MSSILKALEKVEQERNAQHEGPLGRFHKERERRPVWVLPACVLSGAAAAALITFAAMGGFSGAKAPAKGAVAQAPRPLPAQAPPPAPVVTEAVASPVLQVERSVPAQAAPAAEVQVLRPSLAKGKVAAPSAGNKEEVRNARPAPALSAKGASAAAPPAVADTPEEAPAADPAPAAQGPTWVAPIPIRVTGIAWQKDAGSSVAMINGRQVYEGETVEGSRVKEILPDRVRFISAGGGMFDVPLGAGR